MTPKHTILEVREDSRKQTSRGVSKEDRTLPKFKFRSNSRMNDKRSGQKLLEFYLKGTIGEKGLKVPKSIEDVYEINFDNIQVPT